MRSRDKLNEATFFLDKFEYSSNERDRRYFFGAFVSAWRSITFVVQKDFRSEYGSEFDEWYSIRVAELRETEAAGTFLKLRTVLQKEGNRYPLVSMKLESVNGDSISFDWDVSKGKNGLVKFQVDYIEGPSFPVDEDSDEESLWVDRMVQILVDLPATISGSKVKELQYCLGDNLEPVSLEKVIELCHINLSAVSKLVDEAERKFGDHNK